MADESRVDPGFSALLVRAAAGDEEALAELHRRYQDAVRARVRARAPRMLRRRYDVHDIAQSVFVEVLRDLPRFEDRGEAAFRAWLFTKVEGKVKTKLAKMLKPAGGGRREVTAQSGVLARPVDRDAGPATHVAAGEDARRLDALVAALPPEQREIVVLRTREQLGFGAIAERLGLASADAARMRFARAVARLRDSWERT